MADTYNLKERKQPMPPKSEQSSGGKDRSKPTEALPPPPARLTSLDAYRGLIMTMLAATAFGIYDFTQIDASSPLWERHDRQFWQQVGFHFEHPEWESKFGLMGVAFWDLIQPAFMFMVGVAMPFSYRRRHATGQKSWTRHLHAVLRALVLVLLGVFLSSIGDPQTDWIFPNVLCQIGLGYLFVYLLLGCKWYWQTTAITAILVGYWALFHFNPPPEDHDYAAVGVDPTAIIDVNDAPVEQAGDSGEEETEDGETGIESGDEPAVDAVTMAEVTRADGTTFVVFESDVNESTTDVPAADNEPSETASAPVEEAPQEEEPRRGEIYQGRFAPWSKNGNFAHFADVKLLNMFPRPENDPFEYNRGGYQTLNFIPSIATMLLGVLCGQILLLQSWGPWKKVGVLILMGGACFGLSLAAELVCPVVKRIWTPSWVLFSGAYVIWGLALFYLLFDALPFKWLAFPLVVVGMNSILMYMMGQLIRGWTIDQVHTHFSGAITTVLGKNALDPQMYAPIVNHSAQFLVFWLFAYWLYRQRYFLRI